MRFFLLLAYAFLCLPSYAGFFTTTPSTDPAFLVTIRAKNLDGSYTEGTGSIVKKGDKYYVVADSHVSATEHVEILQGKTPLEIQGSLANNFRDAKIFEVKKPSSTFQEKDSLATYDSHLGKFLIVQDGLFQTDQLVPAGETAHVAVRSVLKNASTGWHPPTYLEGGNRNNTSSWNVQSTLEGNELSARMKLAPGMSGAPLVGKLPNQPSFVFEREGKFQQSNATLLGVATRYLCDFDRSYFTPIDVHLSLLEQYETGKRGAVDQTVWQKKDNFSYRDLGNGSVETNTSAAIAGGGSSVDGGGGSSVDGGKGAKTTACQNSLAHQGLVWRGKPVLAFKLKPKDPAQDTPIVLYANLAAVDFLRKNEERYQVETVELGTPVLPLLKEKIPIHSDHFFLESRMLGRSVVCDQKFSRPAQDLIEYRGDHLRLSLSVCGGEQLVFSIDKYGALVGSGSKVFQPVIRVPSKSGQLHTIDLRNLFFTDLAGHYQDEKREPTRQELQRAYSSVFLGLRERENGREQMLDLQPITGAAIFRHWPMENGKFQFMRILEITLPCQP